MRPASPLSASRAGIAEHVTEPMAERFPDVTMIVFARVPAPGAVKTRLVPALGAEGAAELQRWLLARTIDAADRVVFGRHELTLTPVAEPSLLPAAPRARWALTVQRGADLGARMHEALERALNGGGAALLVGSDCPLIDSRYLTTAAYALAAGAEVVLGPSDDGGYVLVGLSTPCPEIFEHVPWGTAGVMAATEARLDLAGRRRGRAFRVEKLPPVFDIDEPADLARWRALEGAQCASGNAAGDS